MAKDAVTPLFRLQIVDRNGKVVVNPFNGGSPMETDLIAACAQKLVPRRFGFFAGRRMIETAIASGIKSAIQSLKDETRFVAHQHR